MIRIDLSGLTQLAAIIPYSSGITYCNQAGGTACFQKEAEGVLYPIYFDQNVLRELEKELRDLVPISPLVADLLDNLFDRGLNEVEVLRVNREKIRLSCDAWVYCKMQEDAFYDVKGLSWSEVIITWRNSD